MAITTQTVKVDLNTGKVLPVVYAHQNDTNRAIQFEVYNENAPFSLSGYTVKFGYVSPKVNGAYTVIAGDDMASGSINGNIVTFNIPESYLAIAGDGLLTMIISGTGSSIRPVNIRFAVQTSADGSDVMARASDFPDAWMDEKVYSWLDDHIDGIFTEEQFTDAVDNWLDDHPEATTTVEDGSITESKLSEDVRIQLPRITRKCIFARLGFDSLTSNSSTFTVLQGGTYDSKREYFVLAFTDSNSENAILVRLDSTFSVVDMSSSLPLGHANDLTYNEKTDCYYIATGDTGTNSGKIVSVSASSLTVEESIALSGINYVWFLSYDSDNDKYYADGSGALKVYDSGFNVIKTINRTYEYNGRGTLTYQSSFVYKGIYILVAFSSYNENYEGTYFCAVANSGKTDVVGQFTPFDAKDEIESVCLVDGVAYGFHGQTFFRISKYDFENNVFDEPQADNAFYSSLRIESDADANDYIIGGAYNIPSSGIAESVGNLPEPVGGNLYVEPQTQFFVRQRYITTTNNEYIRIFNVNNRTWSKWSGSGHYTDISDSTTYNIPLPNAKKGITSWWSLLVNTRYALYHVWIDSSNVVTVTNIAQIHATATRTLTGTYDASTNVLSLTFNGTLYGGVHCYIS